MAAVTDTAAAEQSSPVDQAITRDAYGRVTLPRRYVDYQKFQAAISSALQAERAEDIAFARASGTMDVIEGPWGEIPAAEVFYLGVTQAGKRVKLTQISSFWRYKPTSVLANAGSGKGLHDAYYVIQKARPVVQVIRLGVDEPRLLVERPESDGVTYAQASGLIDGKDLYFRARHGDWSLSIGPVDVIGKPTWYHAEPCGELDCMVDASIYALIEKGVALYRGAVPSANGPDQNGESIKRSQGYHG
jgi:hypothetical protein